MTSIGDLLDGLRKDGLLDNTYIIYSSDHGDMAAEHGLWWKRTYYDASAGVPLLVSGPGVKPGACCDVPVELVDLYPTLCEMAGVSASPGLRGESLLPLCGGREEERVKQHARCELFQGGSNNGWMFRMVRDRNWKLVEFPAPDAAPLLFDLKADPVETTNLLADATGGTTGVDLERLRALLHDGTDWGEIVDRRTADKMRWSEQKEKQKGTGLSSPAQYILADGRMVDADRALYPGL